VRRAEGAKEAAKAREKTVLWPPRIGRENPSFAALAPWRITKHQSIAIDLLFDLNPQHQFDWCR